MSKIKTLKDFNRLPINLHRSSIKEVLPEYFQKDYPNLILFLEYYYDFLDDNSNFGELIQDLYTCRDAEDSLLYQLDLMFNEFALNTGVKFFPSNPREVIRQFAKFYRVKGSKYSAEGFFRAFFLTDAQVHYPKNDLFYLNDSSSEIGVDALKVIQDGGIYQLLSHLVRVDIGIAEWGQLYKKFVHPAGFHLGCEVVIQSPGTMFDAPQPPVFLDIPQFVLEEIGSLSLNFLYDSTGGKTSPVGGAGTLTATADTLQLTDITHLTTMGNVTQGYTNFGRGYNGASASGPTGPIYNVRLHTGVLRDEHYLNKTITTLIGDNITTAYAWAAQSREIWDTSGDSATFIRYDQFGPTTLFGTNNIDSYGYYGTYPSFYVGTGDNPDYLKTPYPSIITTSLAYAELGASHFAADSDMTQEYPLYDSDIIV